MSLKLIREEVSNPSRVYGLDVIRALAIGIVVYEHGNFILGHASRRLASLRIIDGVDLFFVLSGFLIGGMLLREMERTASWNFSNVRKFLVRRWFRTLPNYFLFLLINIVLIYLGWANGYLNKYLVTFLVFFQNFIKPYDFLYWESWSLSVEEWFYLLFPLMLIGGTIVFRNNKKWLFLFCSCVFILFSTMVRFYKAERSAFDYGMWDQWIRKLVICRFDSIGFGLIAAWIHYYLYDWWKKCKWISLSISLLLFWIVLKNNFESNTYYTETLYFTTSAIAAMLLLPVAEQTKRSLASAGKLVTFISIISYAMYLSNMGVVGTLIRNNFDYASHPVLYYLIYWLVTIVFSSLVYAYFEKPLTNLREHFS
jgi:peptidoglycan/LPS O-acetylase OafA/YrhL